MKHSRLAAALLVVIGSVTALAQSAPSSSGLDLLKRVAEHYTNAKSYYIEEQKEGETSSKYSQQWLKSEFIAAEAPGNRFYYEGHSAAGSGVMVADGKTVWRYRPDEHRYITRPQTNDSSGTDGLDTAGDMAINPALSVRSELEELAKHFKSAESLPDASLMEKGHLVSCYVVRVHDSDEIRPPLGESYDKTIWIDKKREIVLRIVEHIQTHSLTQPSLIERKMQEVKTYTNTVIDGTPRDSLFNFIPPKGVNLARDFSNAVGSWEGSKAGAPTLPLRFKPANGKVIPIESFRGRPVLVDFWATWCAPCVASLPDLAKIYLESRDKGLVLISVDMDENASTGASLFARKDYTWPDYHDADRTVESFLGRSSIPRLLLIDAQGLVVYDTTGTDMDVLRTHLADLGPEFRDLAPKPKPAASGSPK